MGTNSVNNQTGYSPPKSKGPGPKTYVYNVYALSAPPKITVPASQVSRDVLLSAIKDLTLASAELSVIYTRSGQSNDNQSEVQSQQNDNKSTQQMDNSRSDQTSQEQNRRPRGGELMRALDTDGNGELSPTEIANATTAMKSLDKNGDGILTGDELRGSDDRMSRSDQPRREDGQMAGNQSNDPQRNNQPPRGDLIFTHKSAKPYG